MRMSKSVTFQTGTRVRFTGLKGRIDDRIYVTGVTFPADALAPEMVEMVEIGADASRIGGAAATDDLEPVP